MERSEFSAETGEEAGFSMKISASFRKWSAEDLACQTPYNPNCPPRAMPSMASIFTLTVLNHRFVVEATGVGEDFSEVLW